MGVKISNIRYFIITIDTEADNAWSSPDKIEMENFKEIPRFQELCEKYNIIPTYLLTYEYATYQPAIDYLKPKAKLGKCEIGHHLHVWTTPPFQNEKNGVDMDWIQAYQYELPDDLFYKKAQTLYQAIVDNFGIKPTSHRAGRWGIDERSIKWLINNKFLLDTSVVPGISYSNNIGKSQRGPNFLHKPEQPYKWEISNGKNLLEYPVSVFQSCPILKSIENRLNIDFFKKVMHKIFPTYILRPNPKISLNNYSKILNKQSEFFNLMLHSSELAKYCSPFTKSVEDYNKIWNILEFIFVSAIENKFIPISLSEVKYIKSNKL